MEQYILPLFCVLISFMACASCLRFIFSRESLYWIFPFFLSVILLILNGSILYSGSSLAYQPFSTSAFLYAALTIVWYITIIIFHYGLKKAANESKYAIRVRKNLTESRYLTKLDEKQHLAYLKRRARYWRGHGRKYDFGLYPMEWVDLFDKD